jgi:hypothetical protein
MKTMMMMTDDKKKMMMINCEVGSDDTDVTGGAEGYGVLTETVVFGRK